LEVVDATESSPAMLVTARRQRGYVDGRGAHVQRRERRC
jgi:hypothetical protein